MHESCDRTEYPYLQNIYTALQIKMEVVVCNEDAFQHCHTWLGDMKVTDLQKYVEVIVSLPVLH